MALMPAFRGLYPTANAYLLRGLAVAGQARVTEGDERAELVSELDEMTQWLAGYAAGAPDNFLHMVRLLDAERAWTTGDFQAAALAFNAARREASGRQRPWHRALIAERAARFRLAHGMDHEGYELLARARQEYLDWGANAKVDQLDWAFPTLQAQPDATAESQASRPARRSGLTPGTIDLLGILSASQALSSETSVEDLHARMVDVLGSMMGATGVHLVLWSDERQSWRLLAPDGDGDSVAVGGTGDGDKIPAAVLRYVQRTREPLIVDDAGADDRFAADPYFGGGGGFSLLAVPIESRGALNAVLLLENRLLRGAFTAGRLESVKLIAGQLAVSLDNARLYAEHRRIADEQAALRRVATLVAQSSSPAEVMDAVAAEIERLLAADGIVLARYETDEELTVVAHRGAGATQVQPGTRVGQQDDLVRALDVRATTGVPIVVDGRRWGVAIAEWRREESAPADGEERMVQFARLLAIAIANAHSRDRLTASRARLVTEADAARSRVVRDLHDGAQHRLVNTVLALELAHRALPEDRDRADELVAEALSHAYRANEDLRELAHGVLPADLTSAGLRGGVAALVERLDLAVSVDVPAERHPSELEASAYFVVAEALTNIVKHAQADTAAVSVSVQDAILRLEVRDDGIGGADPQGRGLVGLNDRVTALGGELEVDSPLGAGTIVTATLPVSRDQETPSSE